MNNPNALSTMCAMLMCRSTRELKVLGIADLEPERTFELAIGIHLDHETELQMVAGVIEVLNEVHNKEGTLISNNFYANDIGDTPGYGYEW